ncbi:hypothetical protein CC78DRAFT_595516 [Lojkania enalia]|uniref:Uncharacterized protein n=1 Tax=Lojkania enalia TaxID=147567 RepID=A0A9P4JW89_9PLEO|nr:hypothetical protein CC78DRAFT_595516 [Didymosphaeria enalia]
MSSPFRKSSLSGLSNSVRRRAEHSWRPNTNRDLTIRNCSHQGSSLPDRNELWKALNGLPRAWICTLLLKIADTQSRVASEIWEAHLKRGGSGTPFSKRIAKELLDNNRTRSIESVSQQEDGTASTREFRSKETGVVPSQDTKFARPSLSFRFDEECRVVWTILMNEHYTKSDEEQIDIAPEVYKEIVWIVNNIRDQAIAPRADFGTKRHALEIVRNIGETICQTPSKLGQEIRKRVHSETSLEDAMVCILRHMSQKERETMARSNDALSEFYMKVEDLALFGASHNIFGKMKQVSKYLKTGRGLSDQLPLGTNENAPIKIEDSDSDSDIVEVVGGVSLARRDGGTNRRRRSSSLTSPLPSPILRALTGGTRPISIPQDTPAQTSQVSWTSAPIFNARHSSILSSRPNTITPSNGRVPFGSGSVALMRRPAVPLSQSRDSFASPPILRSTTEQWILPIPTTATYGAIYASPSDITTVTYSTMAPHVGDSRPSTEEIVVHPNTNFSGQVGPSPLLSSSISTSPEPSQRPSQPMNFYSVPPSMPPPGSAPVLPVLLHPPAPPSTTSVHPGGIASSL